VPLHLKGLSDTRWNCRASSLRRLQNETVFRAAVATVEHVSSTTTDGSVRGTAAGLLMSLNSFKFVLSITLFTPVLEAINNVSEYLQSSDLDILRAQQQVTALKHELRRLRGDDIWDEAVTASSSKANALNIDDQLPAERVRKVS
jgi:hypothetical protein